LHESLLERDAQHAARAVLDVRLRPGVQMVPERDGTPNLLRQNIRA
jgi:hypothetical protein